MKYRGKVIIPTYCEIMSLTPQFCRSLRESLADNVDNQMIESILYHYQYDMNMCLSNINCNIEFMLLLIENSIIILNRNNHSMIMINEERLHNRAKLMQKFIMQDDLYLLEFLCHVIEFLYKKKLSLNEIDKVINVLNFEDVIPLYIRNHWTYARKPNGQQSDIEDRLFVIRHCYRLKFWMSYSDNNEYS